jgi:hypothetical protein
MFQNEISGDGSCGRNERSQRLKGGMNCIGSMIVYYVSIRNTTGEQNMANSLILFQQFVSLQFSVNGYPADAQRSGNLGNVTSGHFQGMFEQSLLNLLEGW